MTLGKDAGNVFYCLPGAKLGPGEIEPHTVDPDPYSLEASVLVGKYCIHVRGKFCLDGHPEMQSWSRHRVP